MRLPGTLTLVALLAVSAPAVPVQAQFPFGKNKIVFKKLEWKQIKTDRVTLYFYPEERVTAGWALSQADSICRSLAEKLNFEQLGPVDLILYNSPADFQQTNVVPYLISESVGGLTDLFKGRVLVPNTGSFHRLKRVLAHELVHALMLQKLEELQRMNAAGKVRLPPLWYTEGLAEYLSRNLDAEAEMTLTAALMYERLVPIDQMWRVRGTLLMYKEGQSILEYLAKLRGEETIVRILEYRGSAPDFGGRLQAVTGLSLDELSDGWTGSLKRHFYASLEKKEIPSLVAHRLTSGTRHNLKAISLSGCGGRSSLAYFSIDPEGVSLRLRTLTGKREEKKLLEEYSSNSIQSFHVMKTRLDASPSGEVALVARRGYRDGLVLIGPSGKRRSVPAFSGLVSLASPSWSPDGGSLVFSAQSDSGWTDLYAYDLKRDRLDRLTHDWFDDRDPDWSPDGRYVCFSSDRTAWGDTGAVGICVLDLETSRIRLVTSGNHRDLDPRWSPDGKWVLFSSDRDGTFNLYLTDLGDSVARVTNSALGVLCASWSEDGRSVYFSSIVDGYFQVFEQPLRGELRWQAERKPLALGSWRPASETHVEAQDYKPKWGLDFIQGATVYDPDFGNAGWGQLAVSDVLGDRSILLYFGAGTSGAGSFWRGLEGGMSYVNRSGRMAYGAGVFSLGRYALETGGRQEPERRTGVVFFSSYPFTFTDRLDVYADLRKAQFTGANAALMLSNYLSYVRDTARGSKWGFRKGERGYLTLGASRDVRARERDSYSFHCDLRKYIGIARGLRVAARFLYRSSWGKNPQVYFLGGGTTLRGYGRNSLAGTRILLLSTELRFPFLRRLTFSLGRRALELPLISGAVFFDSGETWRNGWSSARSVAGGGLFVGGGYYPVVRLDAAWFVKGEPGLNSPAYSLYVGFNY